MGSVTATHTIQLIMSKRNFTHIGECITRRIGSPGRYIKRSFDFGTFLLGTYLTANGKNEIYAIIGKPGIVMIVNEWAFGEFTEYYLALTSTVDCLNT